MRPHEDEGGKKGHPRIMPRHAKAELSQGNADTRFRSRPGSKKHGYRRRPVGYIEVPARNDLPSITQNRCCYVVADQGAPWDNIIASI